MHESIEMRPPRERDFGEAAQQAPVKSRATEVIPPPPAATPLAMPSVPFVDPPRLLLYRRKIRP